MAASAHTGVATYPEAGIMIEDILQELTGSPSSGEDLGAADELAAEYGATPLDLGVAGGAIAIDPAVGEPLQVFYQVFEEFTGDVATVGIALVNDTDGEGDSEAVLLDSGDVDVAELLIASGPQLLGVVAAGAISMRYLSARFTLDDAATAGMIRVWLQKGAYVIPVNAGAL